MIGGKRALQRQSRKRDERETIFYNVNKENKNYTLIYEMTLARQRLLSLRVSWMELIKGEVGEDRKGEREEESNQR